MSEPTSGPFTSSRLPGSHQSNPPTQLRDSTLATVVLKWELEILRDIDVIEKELTVEYDTEPGRGADDSDGMDISSGGETETKKGDLGEEGSDNWRYRIDLLGLRVELLGVLRKMAMGEIGAEEMQECSSEVCSRWARYDVEAAYWQALDEQQNPAQAFSGLQTAEDEEMTS